MSDYNKETGNEGNWNMAIATLQRLSRLLDSCAMFSQSEDFINWFKSLFILRRHLMPFMKPDERTSSQEDFNKLPKGWRLNGNRINPIHTSSVHKLLDEVEIRYLTIMKREGLLMPKSDDPNFAING